jgi:hypothetical protein
LKKSKMKMGVDLLIKSKDEIFAVCVFATNASGQPYYLSFDLMRPR